MRIVSFGQVVNLERGGAFSHQITLEMPNGRRHSIETDEGTIQQLIDAYTGASPNEARGNGQSIPQTTPAGEEEYQRWRQQMEAQSTPPTAPVEDDDEFEDGAELFGGDYDPGEVAVEAASQIAEEPEVPTEGIMGAVSEVPVQQAPMSGGLGQSPPQQAQPRKRQPPVDRDGFVMPVRSRTVQKDEMGYPIVPRSQRAPAPNIPDDDGSEDGTQI